MNTTTTLHCGITHNGNAVATTADGNDRFLITKHGEFKTGTGLQFPSDILQDRVSSTEEFPTPETMLRQYFKQKTDDAKAEKDRAERLAAIPFSNSFVIAGKRVKHAEDSRRSIHQEFSTFKNSPTLLKKALKKAEANATKRKELNSFKKLCEKTLASLKNAAPQFPLKGAGNRREDFPMIGNNKKMQIVFAAIPANHKDEISSRRQKGYFSWSPIISLEAAKKVGKLIELAKA